LIAREGNDSGTELHLSPRPVIVILLAAAVVAPAPAMAATTVQSWASTGAEPRGIAIDTQGNVFTANYGSNSVTRISANGLSTAQFGGSTGTYPYAIAVDGDGNVFTANTTSGTVTRISPDRGPLGFTTGDLPEVAVGARIPPLGACTVELSWAPTSAGPLSGGQLRIACPDGSGSGKATVLTGTARAAASVTPMAVLVAIVVRSRPRATSGRSLRVGIGVRNTRSVAVASVTSCVTLPRNLIPTRTVGARRSGRTRCFAVGVIPAGRQITRTITMRATPTRPITRYISGTARAPGLSIATAPRVVVRISPCVS